MRGHGDHLRAGDLAKASYCASTAACMPEGFGAPSFQDKNMGGGGGGDVWQLRYIKPQNLWNPGTEVQGLGQKAVEP